LNARIKLNSIAIWSALIVGAVFGYLFSSWIVFVLVSGGIIASGIYSQDIRIGSTKRGGRRRR
jgi:hypothetical protein